MRLLRLFINWGLGMFIVVPVIVVISILLIAVYATYGAAIEFKNEFKNEFDEMFLGVGLPKEKFIYGTHYFWEEYE